HVWPSRSSARTGFEPSGRFEPVARIAAPSPGVAGRLPRNWKGQRRYHPRRKWRKPEPRGSRSKARTRRVFVSQSLLVWSLYVCGEEDSYRCVAAGGAADRGAERWIWLLMARYKLVIIPINRAIPSPRNT